MSAKRSHVMTRRQLLKRFGLASAGILAAACMAPAATPAPAAPTTGPMLGPGGEELADDQTLRVVGRSFARYDPASDGSGFNTMFIQHIWMSPFINDAVGNVHPWLATHYEANDDLTAYTIHLDPRAVWSDGSPVLAQEAKDYWTWGLKPDSISYTWDFGVFTTVQGAAELHDGSSDEFSGVVVVDDHTIRFDLVSPDPIFIQRMALMNAAFVKMEDVNKGPEYSADGTVRTNGPFKIKVWDATALQFELEQNPNWWGEKKPYLTRIVAQNAADENISMLLWRNNEVDAMLLLSSLRFQLRETDAPETFIPIPQPICLYYVLNSSRPPMEDPNVRKALIHAVDWQAAISAAWEGNYDERLMRGLLTPEMPCYTEGQWPDLVYDPELARQELAASTYGSADALGLIRITPGGVNPNYIRVGEIMMEQWRTNLGITNVEMRQGGMDAWGQDANLVQVRRRSWGGLMPDPGNFVRGFYEFFVNPSDGSFPPDPEIEAMLAEMAAMPRDSDEFCAIIQELERRIMGVNFVIPMIWDLWEYNVKPWVKGVESNMQLGWNTLMDVYIAKH